MPAASPAPEAATGRALDQEAVLLVEDERVTRKAMALLLTASGYSTRAFGSAEEARHWVEQGGLPRVALIDLDLPGMNGLELIGWLEQAGPAISPVLITAAGDDALVAALQQRGVDYLRKPVDFDSLLCLLDRKAKP